MGNRAVISKEQILDAAYDISVTQGLGALSIRSVAAACGVAVGTVYNSYPTKSDLVNDVVGRFWQQALLDCMPAHAATDKDSEETAAINSPCNFVDFCRHLASKMTAALEEFRRDFLDGLTALDAYDLAGARRREATSSNHVRQGLLFALNRDSAIKRERLTGPLEPNLLCDLVWETMLAAARSKKPLDETLFTLLSNTLY